MKRGRHDHPLHFLIAGLELTELKQHTEDLPESFGLDRRIAAYKGTKPIGFYHWDLDCLLDVLSMVLEDPRGYPIERTVAGRRETIYVPRKDPRCEALTALFRRLRTAYDEALERD